jgi:hypothetical protein
MALGLGLRGRARILCSPLAPTACIVIPQVLCGQAPAADARPPATVREESLNFPLHCS